MRYPGVTVEPVLHVKMALVPVRQVPCAVPPDLHEPPLAVPPGAHWTAPGVPPALQTDWA